MKIGKGLISKTVLVMAVIILLRKPKSEIGETVKR